MLDTILPYVLPRLIDLALTGLALLVGWVLNQIRVYLAAKISNEKFKAAFDKVFNGIQAEVEAAEGTLSKGIRAAAADGRITKVEATDALTAVGTQIYDKIKERYAEEIKHLDPDVAEGLRIVRTEVEAAYTRIRKN